MGDHGCDSWFRVHFKVPGVLAVYLVERSPSLANLAAVCRNSSPVGTLLP
jgi:hypothetical protein